ncbi:MAG: DUF4331 family protein [Myxococcota bacterium]
MKITDCFYLSFLVALTVAMACGDDDPADGTPDATADGPGDATADGNPDADASMPAEFDFRTEPAAMFTQVDRTGMPAVSTALVFDERAGMAMRKQAYNLGTPTQDGALMFADDLLNGLGTLHAVLDDDLRTLSLMPCDMTPMGAAMLPRCVTQTIGGTQVVQLVVPDMLTVDPSAPAGFPNGRQLDEKVVDITLSIILLDLEAPNQDPTTLLDLSQGTGTDVPFLDAFPYVGEPHAN